MTSKSLLNVLFIDTNVQGYENLVSNATPDTEVVLIGSGEDGIDAIATALAGRSNLDSIQILSHGSSGNLQIGTSWLNAESLQDYSAKIRSWGNALGETGDILFLGCNFAGDEAGIDLIQQISQLTGADVAASADITGSSALGGDWDLEAEVGDVDTLIGIEPDALASYDGTLAIGQGLTANTTLAQFQGRLNNPLPRYTGVLITEGLVAQDYTFQVYVDDDAQLKVGNDILIDEKNGNVSDTKTDFKIVNNSYAIALDYQNAQGAAFVELKWKPGKSTSTGDYVPIPARRLFPGPLDKVPTLNVSPVQSSEDGKTVKFKITADKIPDFTKIGGGNGITVYYKISGNNGLGEQDFLKQQNLSIEKSIDITQLETEITLDLIDDPDFERNEQVTLTLEQGAYLRGANQAATVNVLDNEPLVSVTKIADKTEGEIDSKKDIARINFAFEDGTKTQTVGTFDLLLDIKGTARIGSFENTQKGSDYKLFYTTHPTGTRQSVTQKLVKDQLQYFINVPVGTEYITLQAEDINDELLESTENIDVRLLKNDRFYGIDKAQTVTVNLLDNEPTVSLGKVVNPTEGGFGSITTSSAGDFSSTITSLEDAVTFNGSQYVAIDPSNSLNLSNTGSFTQEAWILPQFTDDGTYGIIGYNAGNVNAYPSISLVKNSSGTTFRIGFGNGATWNTKDIPPAQVTNFNPNGWNHVATTFDGTDYKLYVNAVEVFSTTDFAGQKLAPTQQLDIGKTGTNYFKGAIDEVRLWSTARSAGEIQQSYIDQLDGNEEGLIGYWDFNRNFEDKSGNGSNGFYVQPVTAFSSNSPNLFNFKLSQEIQYETDYSIESWAKTQDIKNTKKTTILFQYFGLDKVTGLRSSELLWLDPTQGKILIDRTIFFPPSKFGADNTQKSRISFDIPKGMKLENTWHHFALTSDGKTGAKSLFIDGNKIGTTNMPKNIIADSHYVSSYSVYADDNNSIFAGASEARFWKRELTAEEIKANFQRKISGYSEDLIGYHLTDTNNNSNTNLTKKKDPNLLLSSREVSSFINNPAPQIGYVEVNLDKPVEAPQGLWVDYDIERTGGTASKGTDFFNSRYRKVSTDQKTERDGIIIPQGSTSGRIYLSTIADALVEGDETVNVKLRYNNFDSENNNNSVGNSNYAIGSISSQTITIKDNNAYQRGVVLLDSNNQIISDRNKIAIRNESATFNVELSSQPTPGTNVVVTLSTNKGNLDGTTRTFNSTNWNTPQIVTLTGVTADGEITAKSETGSYPFSNEVFNFTTNPDLKVTEGSTEDAIPVTPQVSIVSQGNVGEDSGLSGNFVVNLSAPAPKGGIDVNYTMTGDATPVVDYQGIGNTLKFDGKDDYLSTSIQGLNQGKTAHTIEAWVYLEKLPSQQNWLLMLGKHGEGSLHWIIHPDGSMQNGAWANHHFNPKLEVGKWTHLATSFDGTNLTQYVNGQKFAESRPSRFNLTNTSLTLGKADDGPSYFQGQIRDFRIWSTARTAADIQTNQDVILKGNETGLITYYQGNPTTDLSVTDISSNNNHGTLHNGATYTNTGTLSIPEGETQGIIPVLPISDRFTESNETVTVSLTNGNGYTVNNGQLSATLNISDDDPAAIEVVNATITGKNKYGYSSNLVDIITNEPSLLPNEPYPTVGNTVELKNNRGESLGSIALTQAHIDTGKITITPSSAVTANDVDSLKANLKENSALNRVLNINREQLKRLDNGSIEIELPTISDRAHFAIRLQTKPTADVTIEFTGIDATEGSLDKSTVTFTPQNWDTYQVVAVTGVDDAAVDGAVSYKIQAEVKTTTDRAYLGKTFPITIKNLDDDEKIEVIGNVKNPSTSNLPTVTIGNSVTATEGTNQATVEVKLSTPATQNLEVIFDISGGTAKLNQDYQLLSQGTLIHSQSGSPFDNVDVGENSSITFVDLDRDGDLDAALGSNQGLKYYQNVGRTVAPVFQAQTDTNNPFNNINFPTFRPTFGDLNGDGTLDLIVGKNDGQLDYYLNNGTQSSPRFQLPNQLNPIRSNPISEISLGAGIYTQPVLGDWDKDGKLDLFVGSNSGFSYYQNTGTKGDAIFTHQSGPKNSASSSFNFDIDGNGSVESIVPRINTDGKFDLFDTTNQKSYLNIGTLSAPKFTLPPLRVSRRRPNKDRSLELNADGILDLIVTGQNTNFVVETTKISTGIRLPDPSFNSPLLNDLDKDGDLDLFVGKADGSIDYYQNKNGDFVPNDTDNPFLNKGYTADLKPQATPTLVDFDGDGDLDAFVGNADGTIKYYEQFNVVKFAPGETTKTVNIAITEDLIAEGKEDIKVSLYKNIGDSGQYNVSAENNTTTVTIDDNDTARVTITKLSGTNTSETGDIVSYNVKLNSQPTAPVTVYLGSQDETEGLLAKNSSAEYKNIVALEFTPDNWDQNQTFSVKGVDDLVADGDISYKIIPTASSEDLKYNKVTVDLLTLSNTDNDSVGFTIRGAGKAVEGRENVYGIKLNSQPVGDIRVIMTPANDQIRLNNEFIGQPHTLTFTSDNWNLEQTVRATALDDSVVEYLHSSKIDFKVETGKGSNFESKTDNNAAANALDLGKIAGGYTGKNLAIAPVVKEGSDSSKQVLVSDDVDWYKFTIPDTGNVQNFVEINFDHSKGDLKLELYSASDLIKPISTSDTSSSINKKERVELNGQPVGEYYLKVSGVSSIVNGVSSIIANQYELSIADEDYQFTKITPQPLNVIIEDNDLPTARIVAGPTASEVFGQPSYFTIQLNALAPLNDNGINVNYRVIGGTATIDERDSEDRNGNRIRDIGDYQIQKEGSVRIAPGDIQNNLIVVPIDDKLVEGTTALKLDGKDDYLSTSVKGLVGNTPHTIEAWVYLEKLPTERNWLLMLGTPGTGSEHWVINNNGVMQNGSWAQTQFTPTLEVGKWTHLATSFDGTNLTQYVNGRQWGESRPASFNFTNSPDLTIGKAIDGNFFQGQLRDVRIWNKARTATEIQANQDQALNGQESGLVTYYRDATTEGKLTDLTAQGNHAVLHGGVQFEKTASAETVVVQLLPGEGYQLPQNTQATLKIQDDDVPGVRIVQVGDNTVVREGETSTFEISLLSEPKKPVTITLTPGAEIEFENANGAKVFVDKDVYKFGTATSSTSNSQYLQYFNEFVDLKLNSLVTTDKGKTISFDVRLRSQPSCLHITFDDGVSYDVDTNTSRKIDFSAAEGTWDRVHQVVLTDLDLDSGNYKIKATIDGQDIFIPITHSIEQVEKQTTTITIEPKDWHKLQTITIKGSDDGITEAGLYHQSNINYTITSDDTSYKGIVLPSQRIDVLDRILNPEDTAAAVQGGLTLLQQSLDSLEIPLVGGLKGKLPPIISDIADKLTVAISAASNLTGEHLSNLIKGALSSIIGLEDFISVTVETSLESVAVLLEIKKEYKLFSLSLDTDLGLDALGIGLKTEGELKSNFDFDIALGFGIHRDFGFYIDTDQTKVEAELKLNLDGFKGEGNLGFLRLDLQDDVNNKDANGNPTPDKDNPTELAISFKAGINDLDNSQGVEFLDVDGDGLLDVKDFKYDIKTDADKNGKADTNPDGTFITEKDKSIKEPLTNIGKNGQAEDFPKVGDIPLSSVEAKTVNWNNFGTSNNTFTEEGTTANEGIYRTLKDDQGKVTGYYFDFDRNGEQSTSLKNPEQLFSIQATAAKWIKDGKVKEFRIEKKKVNGKIQYYFDKDGDNQIGENEKITEKQWKKYDLNNNLKLDADVTVEGEGTFVRGAGIAFIDTNKNGKLDSAEYSSVINSKFGDLTISDDAISSIEYWDIDNNNQLDENVDFRVRTNDDGIRYLDLKRDGNDETDPQSASEDEPFLLSNENITTLGKTVKNNNPANPNDRYVDWNDNGQFDIGEPHSCDLDEPFAVNLSTNEAFIDLNGNGLIDSNELKVKTNSNGSRYLEDSKGNKTQSTSEDEPLSLGKTESATIEIAGTTYKVIIKDRVQFVDLDENGKLTVDSDGNPLEPNAAPNNDFGKATPNDLIPIRYSSDYTKFLDDGDRLTLTELRNFTNDEDLAFSDLFSYEFAGNANLGLNAVTSIEGNPAFPSISFDLAVGLPLFNYGNQDASGGEEFSVEFQDITLDFGTFLTKFANPILESVDDIISPIKPILTVLNTDTKIFSYLGLEDEFNRDNIKGVSILDIASVIADGIPANTTDPKLKRIKESIPKVVTFIDTVQKIVDTVDSLKALTASDGSLLLELGSYSLDDLKAASDDLADTTAKVNAGSQGTKTPAKNADGKNKPDPLEQAKNATPAQKSAFEKFKNLQGLAIPLLSDPNTLVRVLLGEPDVDLITYDIPDLDLYFQDTKEFPILSYPVIIKGILGLGFEAKTDLAVGYDTHGLEAWRDSDFDLEKVYQVLDGFYLNDLNPDGTEKDELSASASIIAGLSASIVVVKAVLQGGITGGLGFDLVDVGELQGKSDGKIRGSEITSRINTPLELFNLKGQLDAFASGAVKVGLDLGIIEIMQTIWSLDVGPIPIAKFNVGASGISVTTPFGSISNSYIDGATVFFDSNFNGIWDVGDENNPTELITFTNEYGQYSLPIGLEWDRNGDGAIDYLDGQIISVGGFDTSSGTPAGKFIGLPGASIITPLTSIHSPLVLANGLTPAAAETLIKAQLGLDPNFSLASFDSLNAVGQNSSLGLDIYLAHIEVQALFNHARAFIDGLQGQSADPNNLQLVQSAFAKFLYQRSTKSSEPFNLKNQEAILSFYTFLAADKGLTATAEQLDITARFLAKSNQLLEKVKDVGASKSLQEALPALASVKRVVQSEIPKIITEFLTNPTEKTLAKFNDALYQNYTLVSDDINSFGNRSIKITSSTGKLIENSPDLVQFTIELSDPAPNQGLTVLYSISGTGTLGQDYNLNTANKTGEIYIAPGTTKGIIEVSLLNDELVENIETISINLTAAGEGYLIDPTASAGVLLILDDEKNNSIVSTTGNSVKGTFGDDRLVGSEGEDRLLGLYGNDTIEGQAGDDFIQGGHGKDSIIGGAGSDRLEGNFGDDIIDGNAGSDHIDGGTGNDRLTGGSEFDFIVGGTGNDTLAGNSGNDQLEGGVGNDYLDGNEDNDWLNGDDGDDILIGNRGDDLISGGHGKDAFFFESADRGFDTILDFNPDEGDRIQISRAGFGVDNLDGFRFVSGILDFQGQNLALLQNNGQTYSYFPNLADIIEIVDEPTISTHAVKAPPELVATSLPPFIAIPEPDERTILDDIVNRGYLKLISNSAGDSIDLVFARTLAIALFGDPSKIEFISTETYAESFELLGKRAADLSIDRITHTLARDSEFNIDFSPLYLYDAQSFVVSHQSKIENIFQLDGKTIGLIEDSTTYANITNVFNSQGIKFTPKFYADLDELMAGYLAGEVDAASTDKTLLSESLKDISKLAEHSFIDVDLSKEPIGIAIPDNDSTWADFVRWVNYVPVQAEELGIDSKNVLKIFSENLDNNPRDDASISIRRFLGIEGNIYQAFAKFNVQPDFVVKIIQAVGNYAEIYQKYFPGEERNRNELSSNGGLIYSPPFAGTAAEINFIDNNDRNVLTEVLQRGKLVVGTSDTNFGFSVPDSSGKLVGFDIDLSTALAAALFGDAKAVEFVLEDGLARFTNAANGIVDISAAQATHNLVRDTQYGVDFTPTYIYTGQGVVARKASGIFNLSTLNGRKIGAVANTTSIQNLKDALVKYSANADFTEFTDEVEMFAAYQRGEVDAVTSDIPLLSSVIANFADAQDHELLNVTISQEPLAMVIDENQSEWGDVVRWLQYALLQAEELGITQANIDRLVAENIDKDPTNNAPDNVRILLGLEGDIGKKLGIPNDFVVNAIKAVGNYGEIYERHFKDLPRDFNQLSTNFGLQIPYPLGISPDPTPVNFAPTAIRLVNTTTQLSKNIDTTGGIKVGHIAITDDAQGKNQLSLSGNDASSFEIRGNNLFFVGSNLDFETKASYTVTIDVDDPTVGNSPDLKHNFTLNLINISDFDVSTTVTSFIDKEEDELGKLNYDLSQVGNATLTASDTALAQTSAAFHNIIGLYQVLDENGTIQANTDINGDGQIDSLDVLNPGDADYVRTAINNVFNHSVLELGAAGDPNKNTNGTKFGNVLLDGGAIYAPFIIANGGSLIPTNGTIEQGIDVFLAQNPNNTAATRDNFMTHTVAYFSFAGANPDGVEHLKNFGDNTFGFEDLPGNLGISDFDFNDSVFKFSLSNSLKPNSENIAGIYGDNFDSLVHNLLDQ